MVGYVDAQPPAVWRWRSVDTQLDALGFGHLRDAMRVRAGTAEKPVNSKFPWWPGAGSNRRPSAFQAEGEVRSETFVLVKLDELDPSCRFRARNTNPAADAERMKMNLGPQARAQCVAGHDRDDGVV